MNNKQIGNSFEKQFCDILSHHGFWCHRMQDKANGQPFDVIASKNNLSAVIDCKACTNNIFQLRRMEQNQIYAMRKWISTGNDLAFFALKIGDEIRMLQYQKLMELRELGVKSLKYEDIVYRGALLEDWIEAIYLE